MADNDSLSAAQASVERIEQGEDSLELDLSDMEGESEGGYDDSPDIWDRFTNSSYDQDLDKIEAAVDLENGGPNRIKRGLMNLADMKIMRTPLYDIPVGVLETGIMIHRGNFDGIPGLGSDSDSEDENSAKDRSSEAEPMDGRTLQEAKSEDEMVRRA